MVLHHNLCLTQCAGLHSIDTVSSDAYNAIIGVQARGK
jgi:hypothetical protein